MRHLVDIHCHILPGVDDGADDFKESLELIKEEMSQGVDQIILTPHFRRGMFETPMEDIKLQYARLRYLVQKLNLDVELYLGCEYHTSSQMVEDLLNGRRPTLNHSPYVLVEFSSQDSYVKIKNQIYDLIANNFIPIIAHIERYPDFVKDLSQVQQCKKLGAYMQITASAVLGKTGWKMKRLCKKLIEAGLVDFIASDAHNLTNRKPDLEECASYLEKKMGSDFVYEVFVKNPERIIRGGY